MRMKAISMNLDAARNSNPIWKPWLDIDTCTNDLLLILGHGLAKGYEKWNVGRLFDNNLITLSPQHIKRISPSKGYYPSNMTVTVPLSDIVVEPATKKEEAKAYTKSSVRKNNKKLPKGKKGWEKVPDYFFENPDKRDNLLNNKKKNDLSIARHSGFEWVTLAVGKEAPPESEMIVPSFEDLSDEVKAYVDYFYVQTPAKPEGDFFSLKEFCEFFAYPYYRTAKILETRGVYNEEEAHKAGKEAQEDLVKYWIDHYKKAGEKEAVLKAAGIDLADIIESLSNKFPTATKGEILRALVTGLDLEDKDNKEVDLKVLLTKDGEPTGQALDTLARKQTLRKPCWLWHPRTGLSTKFESVFTLAAALGLTTASINRFIKEGVSSREGFRVTDTPTPPDEIKDIIQMRELKRRAINLDGPFMKASLSPVQRKILEHCFVLGYTMEETSTILNMDDKVLETLINQAFDTRDGLERKAAERIGLSQDGDTPDFKSRMEARRKRAQDDRRKSRRTKKGSDKKERV